MVCKHESVFGKFFLNWTCETLFCC
jgi:hypothetical protein